MQKFEHGGDLKKIMAPDIAGLILERLHALRSVGAVYMASP